MEFIKIQNYYDQELKDSYMFQKLDNLSRVKWYYLLTNWLAYLDIRANTKPKARRYARPKGGHYAGRGLCIRLYRYASQLVRSLLPD